MKQIINSKYLSLFIFILSIIVAVKIIWTVVSLLFLPNSGENYQEENSVKKLYYRVRLTNESKVIAPVRSVQAPTRTVSSMRGYVLVALYNAGDIIVVTVEKGRKTTIVAKGEQLNGFELVKAGIDHAIFKKNGEEFKLSLKRTKSTNQPNVSRPTRRKAPSVKASSTNNEIVEQDGVKLISRDLLTSYTKNLDKIWKDISISENKTAGKLNGFKINFVKRGSDFEKLGLKKGDVLMGINAQALDSLSAAMNVFKDINNIENLTLTVLRNGKSEDIEYEIQ